MSILSHTPSFSFETATQIAAEYFDVNVVNIKQLPSERDQNLRITTDSGRRYVLKVSNGQEQEVLLRAQNEMINHIASQVGVVAPAVISKDGSQIVSISGARSDHLVRLVPYLEGTPLAAFRFRSAECLSDLGRLAGQFRLALSDFEHAAFHRDFYWDLAKSHQIVVKNLDQVEDQTLRSTIQTLTQRFRRHTAPVTDSLPKSVIHSDLNDGNVIIESGRVSGVIDFGDAVYSWSIAELAIAIAYAVLGHSDPLSAATTMVAAHHAMSPLERNELESLFGLICMRLCVSAVIAAGQQKQRPNDPYLSVSQDPIRRTLPLLQQIPFQLATTAFYQACGIEPDNDGTITWMKANQADFCFPLLDNDKTPSFAVLDCSVSSSWLPSDLENQPVSQMTRMVFEELESAEADIGVGRYLEPRIIYSSDQFTDSNVGGEDRTIHLGIDLFAPVGTPVVAAADGVVECVVNIELPLDYGNLVIVRHEPEEGVRYFTLYGHLANDATKSVSVGQRLTAGDKLGCLGDEFENGGWSPHLHFQIMLDLLDFENDFPGVCVASQREAWSALCPDPNLLLQLPSELALAYDLEESQVLANRRRSVGAGLSIGYQEPLHMIRGWRHWLFDAMGQRYLDAYNNVPHVGHCHPDVVQALTSQAKQLNTNTRYLSEQLNEFTGRLAATMPNPLQVCYVLNSASEANELAIRLARSYTGNTDMIVLEGAYHGHTTTLVDISPYKHDGPGGSGPPDWVHTARVADVYRGPFKDAKTAGRDYADDVKVQLAKVNSIGRGVCGFIAESCPSVGGQIVFPEGYLSTVYESVRQSGGVCIADEVQTAYGRLGSAFYGFELQDVIPDIVVLGKPIGNGHPLAAVVTTPEIAQAFDNGMEFFSTFGGNNVSCAVGLAVLDVVENEELQSDALATGQYLQAEFEKLRAEHSIIGDVRGSGLFLGIELVLDHNTLEPAAEEAAFVVNRMREQRVLVGTDGPLHNVIKIRPPMTFGIPEAQQLVAAMKRSFAMLPPAS